LGARLALWLLQTHDASTATRELLQDGSAQHPDAPLAVGAAAESI
jgi:hypothetical protein